MISKIKFFTNSYCGSSIIYIIRKGSVNINFKIITKERIKKGANFKSKVFELQE